MKTRSKVIWIAVIALALIAAFFGGWWMKEPVIIDHMEEVNAMRNKHLRDSIEIDQRRAWFKAAYLEEEEKRINVQRKLIALLISQEKEEERLRTLPATENVAQFSANTGDSSYIAVIERDTMCISSMQAITEANIQMMEGRIAREMNKRLSEDNEALEVMIDIRDEEIGLAYERVNQLTDVYYKSQRIIDKEKRKSEKLKKKINRRNIAVGVTSGVAIAAIAVIIFMN